MRKRKPLNLIASLRSMRTSPTPHELTRAFTDYAALAKPEAINVADVQASLAADEALLLVFDTRE